MSLDLSLYDDAALEALAPKGVVRRARRDFEAGLGKIIEHAAKSAVVEADRETVQLGAQGPKSAQCTCPATGICRHILLAVMTLNGAIAPTSEAAAPAVDAPSATEELCALSQNDVQSFAGADWQAAVALATSSTNSTIQETGRNLVVDIESSPASVTFLAGLGLKGAAFKGPKTRARVLIAAAALIVRAKQGVALDIAADDDAPTPATGVSQDYLDDAGAKLLQSVRMVLAGASPVAADTLFDIAISARAEAAPRLTSQLRTLTKQAGAAANRLVHFEPETFLSEAARTYALIEALKQAPAEPAFTGVLRRDYQPVPAMDVWILGAVRWQTETGARGLTLHAFEPLARRWHVIVQARGPGQDPSFDPGIAFTAPLWGAVNAKALVGRTVHVPEPLVAEDGAFAPTLTRAPMPREPLSGTRALREAGIASVRWADLRADILMRRGFGLRRRSTPIPALIAPSKFGPLGYDDFTQNYEFDALDQFGDAMRLVMPASAYLDAKRLSDMGRPPLLLVETSGNADRPALRPVAVLHDGGKSLEVINLTLDHWTKQRTALDALQDILPRKAGASRLNQDPLANLARRALQEAVTIGAGEPSPNLERLEPQCDAAGLGALSASLRRLGADRTPSAALATAYLACETLETLSWT